MKNTKPMTKLDQRLAELCAVSQPTIAELESVSVEEIYPDLVGDAYADAMLADLANA
tara:strand:- start:384 stop:554 length:171 start_codon:yes stop_codon:yes gene_type:complete